MITEEFDVLGSFKVVLNVARDERAWRLSEREPCDREQSSESFIVEPLWMLARVYCTASDSARVCSRGKE